MLTDLINCGSLLGNSIQKLMDQVFDFVGDIMLKNTISYVSDYFQLTKRTHNDTAEPQL